METNTSRNMRKTRPANYTFSGIDGLSPDTGIKSRRTSYQFDRANYGAPTPRKQGDETNAHILKPTHTSVIPTNTRTKSSRPYFPLPAYDAPGRPKGLVKKSSAKKVIFRLLSFMLVPLLFGGGFLTWRGYANIHKVFQGTGTVAALSTDRVSPDLLNGEGDGRVNILLLGIGGVGHDGADLTDTIIVLSVDPVNNKAVLLSIPRDLWVKMPVNYFGAYQKINAAYSAGKYRYLGKTDASITNHQAVEAGFNSIDQAVSDVLGISINYHLLVDFKAFQQAIDTVNGVSVDVPNALYDPTMAWENGNNPLLAAAGQQTMNGKEALLYARSRHTSSDFARSERQRQLLVSLKEKVLTLGTLSSPTKVNELINAFGSNAYSDMSTNAASRLLTIMRRISDNNITSIGLTTPPHDLVRTDTVGNLSVVRPIAGFNVYSDIQTYVKSQLQDGYLTKENALTYVYAPSQAQADAQAATLKGLGYNIVGDGVLVKPVESNSLIDLSGGEYAYTKHYLENRYQTQALTSIPEGIQVPESTQFVILVQ